MGRPTLSRDLSCSGWARAPPLGICLSDSHLEPNRPTSMINLSASGFPTCHSLPFPSPSPHCDYSWRFFSLIRSHRCGLLCKSLATCYFCVRSIMQIKCRVWLPRYSVPSTGSPARTRTHYSSLSLVAHPWPLERAYSLALHPLSPSIGEARIITSPGNAPNYHPFGDH